MDGQQFDRLARVVATGASRRSILKKVSAIGFGALLGSRLVERTAAQETCDAAYSPCSFESEVNECCEGLQCTEFGDVDEGGLCWWIPTCTNEGESCAELPCCDQMTCSDEQICEYVPADYCAIENDECGRNYWQGVIVDCCDGFICTQIGEGSLCFPDPDYCVPMGNVCGNSSNGSAPPCCDGLVCEDHGACQPAIVCVDEGERCGSLGGDTLVECCSNLTCIGVEGEGGICGTPDEPKQPNVPTVPVTKLPDTGAGRGEIEASWVAPAAAGITAAVLGGKLLKNMTSTGEDRS